MAVEDTSAAAEQPPNKKARTAVASAPPLFSEGGYTESSDGWFAHSGGEWLHNKSEGAYFHLPTGQLRVVLEDAPADSKEAPKPEAQEAVPDEGPLLRGRVRWFNPKKGFGFIEPLDPEAAAVLDGKDVFIHRNQILTGKDEGEELAAEDVFATLEAGADVTFRLGQQDNGRVCAVKVRAAEEEEEEEAEEMEADEDGEDHDNDEAASEASSVEIDLFEELKSGMHTEKGPGKDKIEDYSVDKLKLPVNVLGETATCVFFGVFDGHGGHHCAEHVSEHLPTSILARLRERAKNVTDEVALSTALLGGFKQTEHNFVSKARRTDDTSGSTACTMTIFGPDDQMRLRLFMANCGDSRAVLCREGGVALRLTEDHKPNLPAEKKRIEAADGGVVDIAGVWRVVLPAKKRLLSKIAGLAVSRSFGDKDFKGPDLVSAEPEITVHEVDWEGDEFVILATDGIWDFLSDKDAVLLVRQQLQSGKTEQKASEALVKRAVEKGSKDDCTALVVRFGWNSKSGGSTDADPNAAPEPAVGTQKAPKEAKEQEEEMGEEGEEEELDEDEDESSALAAMAAAMGANSGAVQGPADDDSDKEDTLAQATSAPQKAVKELPDIFSTAAADEQVEEDEEAAGRKRWDASNTEGPSANTSPLFAGLVPAREELEVGPVGPAGPEVLAGGLLKGLGPSTDKAEPEPEKPESKDAVDADMDMFG
mmetsp:Transcript_28408/g.51303  ORF Transcript_28408/g.51303 Transcript_28408/m.51303 type:complete len:706 (+) Transcript_28408:57-2174(+)